MKLIVELVDMYVLLATHAVLAFVETPQPISTIVEHAEAFV